MTALTWPLLAAAIVCEVAGTLALRLTIDYGARWYAVVGAGYISAFALVSVALSDGMPLGLAYGIWAAAGVALTAILSRFIFREALTRVMGLGIALVIVGVLLIQLGADA